jgi:hypothetical protein
MSSSAVVLRKSSTHFLLIACSAQNNAQHAGHVQEKCKRCEAKSDSSGNLKSDGDKSTLLISGSVILWCGFSPVLSYYGAKFPDFVSESEIISKRSRIVG